MTDRDFIIYRARERTGGYVPTEGEIRGKILGTPDARIVAAPSPALGAQFQVAATPAAFESLRYRLMGSGWDIEPLEFSFPLETPPPVSAAPSADIIPFPFKPRMK